MKKFLVLYRSTLSSKEQVAQMTPEAVQASMGAWMAWANRTGAALVEMGAPIGDSTVLRGSPSQGRVGGYSIVQAESLDAAQQIFDGHPHFDVPGSSIELLEMMKTPGM